MKHFVKIIRGHHRDEIGYVRHRLADMHPLATRLYVHLHDKTITKLAKDLRELSGGELLLLGETDQ